MMSVFESSEHVYRP